MQNDWFGLIGCWSDNRETQLYGLAQKGSSKDQNAPQNN
jgi:hypothetical protein